MHHAAAVMGISKEAQRVVSACIIIGCIALALGVFAYLSSAFQSIPLPEAADRGALLSAVTVVLAFVGSIVGSVLLSWIRSGN